MQIRLADYVADFLVQKGVTDVFTVVGGGAMHLNDALGHTEGLHCMYHHHEQACAIAAESYARLENRPAAVCVTTGPGGTNAITGVLGAWLDSIPMIVISGQVRYDTTARYAERFTEGLPLRAVGDQEYDIVQSVAPMTKYAVMIEDPLSIGVHLERAWHLATTGRPGPVWIDIPVNYQGMTIETEELYREGASADACRVEQLPMNGGAEGALLGENEGGLRGCEADFGGSAERKVSGAAIPPAVSAETAREVLDRIARAKRPVIYAGGGIRLSGGYEAFRKLEEALGIPVVTYWNSIDLVETEDPLYVGRGGNMGDRAGNYAVQNADLVLAIGTRLSIRQVGYNYDTWAREAQVILVDIDAAELKKPTIHVELPIWADAKDFMEAMLREAGTLACGGGEGVATESGAARMFGVCEESVQAEREEWLSACRVWKAKYPVTLPKHYANPDGLPNVYAFIHDLSDRLPEGSLTAVSNGACCVVGHQNYVIKKGTRFIINSAVASMGYGLPAAIGLCVSGKRQAEKGAGNVPGAEPASRAEGSASGYPDTICLEGDGSIMMNLQELQTVVTNRLPIKLFLINNQGYHSIRITQSNIFSEHTRVGIGPESGDLSFPSFEKLAGAFGWPYLAARRQSEMDEVIGRALATEGFVFCEIFTDTQQVWEPKSSAKRLPDGTLVSPPLEDLAPFLPREEVLGNLFVKPLNS